MRAIAELFGRSPFGPLVQHTHRVHEAVLEVRPLIEAFVEGRFDELEPGMKRVSKLEHKADVIKREIREHLPKSLFLPVDRGDMLKFLKEQDSIADTAEDIAVLLTLRKTHVPPELTGPIRDFADQVIGVSERLVNAASELEELQEASFGGRGAEKVLAMIAEVSEGEYEADKHQTRLSRRVYELEDEIDPTSIYFIMKLFRLLGELANHAENTGDNLRMMLTKR